MKHILAMLLALLGASGALAQIYVKVVPEKKTFLSGEAMYMRLTITNNSGVPVELKSREYSSWLDIHVEHSTAGAELPQSKFALFPPLKVPAGMSVSRKIDLRHFYDLSREGNYHVQAVVKMPNQKDMFASQKSLFAVRTGTPMWSQTVAIPASAKRCTFSVCTIAVRGIQKLYVQTKDPDTGVAYNARVHRRLAGDHASAVHGGRQGECPCLLPNYSHAERVFPHQLPGNDGEAPVL